MAQQSVASELRIPLRTGVGDGWNTFRPYAMAAFDLIRGLEAGSDELVAVVINADCNARSVGVTHPDFAAMIEAPGSLGPFARSADMTVIGNQIARIEARLPEAHRAAQAVGSSVKKKASAPRASTRKQLTMRSVGSPDPQLAAEALARYMTANPGWRDEVSPPQQQLEPGKK